MKASNRYLIVICFAISPPLPVTPPSLETPELEPGFFSKSFQNLRLSSAADVHISKIRQEWIILAHLLLLASGHQG